MSVQPPARAVHFVLVDDTRTPDEITGLLGVPADVAAWKGGIPRQSPLKRVAAENSWELIESGDRATDVSYLLEKMYERICEFRRNLHLLTESGVKIVLSIVQYMTTDDPVGPGFAIHNRFLELLAEFEVTLDVDLYVVEQD